MPAFLVHGVPDTHHLWDKTRERLSRRDVLAPDLPGFGASTPPGFRPVKEAYVDWLIDEIARVGEPVDLVGHDWGALLAIAPPSASARSGRTASPRSRGRH